MLLSLLFSVSCAAKSTETRIVEHTCIFQKVEEICKERDGVMWLKITERENEADLAVVKCYKNSEKVIKFTCQP